jgi:hypothetical protein
MLIEKIRKIGINGIKSKNQNTNKVITAVFCAAIIFFTASNTNVPKEKESKPIGLELNKKHICTDTMHYRCDGQCECDGLGCENSMYYEQFEKFKVICPTWDSLKIDEAIKND